MANYNPKTRQIEDVDFENVKGTAEKTIKNIIWGGSELTPEVEDGRKNT